MAWQWLRPGGCTKKSRVQVPLAHPKPTREPPTQAATPSMASANFPVTELTPLTVLLSFGFTFFGASVGCVSWRFVSLRCKIPLPVLAPQTLSSDRWEERLVAHVPDGLGGRLFDSRRFAYCMLSRHLRLLRSIDAAMPAAQRGGSGRGSAT